MATQNSAKSEALDEKIEFEFDGDTYEVPPAKEWDLEVLESYEDGMIATCVRALLGEEQYAIFKAKKRSVGDLNDLFEEVQKALGVEGN